MRLQEKSNMEMTAEEYVVRQLAKAGVQVQDAGDIYGMTAKELRAYRRRLRRQREIRRRCLVFAMTLCLIAVCTISYHALQTTASTGREVVNFKYYTNITIQYGETLWDIADEYIDYNEYKNKSTYIEEVKNINHLDDNCAITAGQHLIVPYFSTEFIE